MKTKASKTVWSTIKFPMKFVSDMSTHSRRKGWKSSCEYIMAAMEFINKHDLDLHGELPPGCQPTATLLANAMMSVADLLNEYPEKSKLIQQVNRLKADLSSTQKELDKSNNSLIKSHDTLKAEKQEALDEMEKQKQEVSRLTAMTKGQDGKLQSITVKVNETLQRIEGDNTLLWRFLMSGRRLTAALETLRWVASETARTP